MAVSEILFTAKSMESPAILYNGILVPVRTSFGQHQRGGKTIQCINVRFMWIC